MFVHFNQKLEEVYSHKYPRIEIHNKINLNYSVERRISGGWKFFFSLKIIVKKPLFFSSKNESSI
jgi:hypothetical protein